MSNNDYNHTELIKTLKNEQLKERYVYDVNGRKVAVIQTRSRAKHGEKALVTYYAYNGATTTVLRMREAETTWDSAWDIADAELPELV